MTNLWSLLCPKDTPVGLKPIYPMASVNQDITLYEGELEMEQETVRLSGKGVVQFQWLPRPGLRFFFDPSPENEHKPLLKDCTLHLLERNGHAKASVFGYDTAIDKGVYKVRGEVRDHEVGQNQDVTSILFHVVNFIDCIGSRVRTEEGWKTWSGRSVIEAGEWRITLDKIEEFSQTFEELEATGGFAITHVGKLERSDGNQFHPKEAEVLFEALFRYLSFCRGAWVAPVLPVGFAENGDRVWEKWRGWKIEGWRKVRSGFNSQSVDGLVKGFPGFYKRWQDKNWTMPLLLSIHWYVEANMTSGGVEGSIILAQTAFELLGWTHLVEERQELDKNGYEKLPAMEKLRRLLSICGIPAAEPSSLSRLNDAAKAQGNVWNDGPQAITEVRNALVHSNPAKSKKVFDEDRRIVHEVWNLSLWYLELILLRTFDYKGEYSSRVAADH